MDINETRSIDLSMLIPAQYISTSLESHLEPRQPDGLAKPLSGRIGVRLPLVFNNDLRAGYH